MKMKGVGIKNGYWTAAVNKNNITLVTPTSKMPEPLMKLGLLCRSIARDRYNTTSKHKFKFNIAVCNKYDQPSHHISPHTDDNDWYAKDLECGPMFASLTLYNDTKPLDGEHARFQVCFDGVWEDCVLEDATILLMPSCIPHQVLPSKQKAYHPRINITLRSVDSSLYDLVRAVSNHARYYRPPAKLIIPGTLANVDDMTSAIIDKYNDCLKKNGCSTLLTVYERDMTLRKNNLKERLVQKNLINQDTKIGPNIVIEALQLMLKTHIRSFGHKRMNSERDTGTIKIART